MQPESTEERSIESYTKQGVNWVGLRTLFLKEVRRFMKVWGQTVLAPLMTNSLYFLIFGVALGARLREVLGVPYILFVLPGLITLGVIRNAFSNASSSIFQAKINGTITDVLVAPLGTFEKMAAYVGASVIRGLIVGTMILLVGVVFADMKVAHPFYALVYAVGVASMFACIGILIALWAEKFDHLNVVPSFVLTPLIYLGGVFYSVDMLPSPWDQISRYDPMLYFVNGIRYGLISVSEIPPNQCLVALGIGVVVSFLAASTALQRGYNLRS